MICRWERLINWTTQLSVRMSCENRRGNFDFASSLSVIFVTSFDLNVSPRKEKFSGKFGGWWMEFLLVKTVLSLWSGSHLLKFTGASEVSHGHVEGEHFNGKIYCAKSAHDLGFLRFFCNSTRFKNFEQKSSTRFVRSSRLIVNCRRSVCCKKVIFMEMQARDARWMSHRVKVRMQRSNYRVGRDRKSLRSQKWIVWGEKKSNKYKPNADKFLIAAQLWPTRELSSVARSVGRQSSCRGNKATKRGKRIWNDDQHRKK